jgi:MFS family permease
MSSHLMKAVAATFGVHCLIVIASLFVPLTAAVIAPALAIPTHLVGYYASITFFAAAVASLATPHWTRKYGAIRVHQIMLLFAVLGLVVLAAKTMTAFVVSGLLIGLGYGPANPASSLLLARYAPPRARARVFALKQTAVPMGGIVAGLLVPQLMTRLDWLGAALTIASACVVGLILISGWRNLLDVASDSPTTGNVGVIAALRLIPACVPLRQLGILALCFAATQFAFLTVFAAVLAERVGWSPIEAGTALSITLAVSVVFRLFWGWVADKAPARVVLAALGLFMSGATISCAFLAPNWPASLVYAVALLFGTSGSSWNALALSEAAQHAPRGHVSEATASVTFCSYTGALLGPAIFSSLTTIAGTVAVPFVALGILAAVPIPLLLLADYSAASATGSEPAT